MAKKTLKKPVVNSGEIERATDERTSQRLHLDWWAFIVAGVLVLLLLVITYTRSTPIKADEAGSIASVQDGDRGKGKTVIISYAHETDTIVNLWPVFVKNDGTVTSGDNIGWKWSDKPLKIPFKEVVKPLLPKKEEG